MATNALNSISKGLEQLSDIKHVTSLEYQPMVDQLEFHLYKLGEELATKPSSINLLSIQSLLEKQFKDIISFYVSKNPALTGHEFVINNQTFTFVAWDCLLKGLDHITKLLSLFPMEGILLIKMENNKVVLSALVKKLHLLDRNREDAYRESRFWFSHKTFLTYEVLEQEHGTHLNLILDFSYDEKSVLVFKCKDFGKLSFSSIITQYEVKKESDIKTQNHLCLEIDDNCQLMEHNTVPSKVLGSIEAYTVFHFPFLFRPVSLIIPYRGELASVNGLGIESRLNNVQFIDFFSLLSQN